MTRHALAVALAMAAGTSTAVAQSAAMKPFELNMDRVKVNGGKELGYSKTYFVPSVNLIISAHGSVWSQKGGAQAHGKFFVDGLEKSFVQGLVKKVEDDLVTKLRGAGITVLTYADLKDEPDVKGRGRDEPNEKWGFPVRKVPPLTYIIATPSDEQSFNNPIQGPVWSFRGLAKDKQIVVLVPEITYTTPQMFGQTSSGYKRDEAGIATDPAMKLAGAMIYAFNGKGGAANIFIQEHGMRLATESAGRITKLNENKTEFSKEWNRTSGDFSMTLDPVAFEDGLLRVAFAINDLIVNEVKKQQK